MIDREPEFIKYTPENPISPIPVVIFMGSRVTPRDYQLCGITLAAEGFTTYCSNPNLKASDRPKKWGIFTDEEVIKQEAFANIIETVGYPNETGVKQIYGIGHSSAALYLLPVIEKNPDAFSKLILLAPAGIHPKMNPIAAVYKLWQTEREYTKDKRLLQQLGLYAQDQSSNGIDWRSFIPEALTIATSVITPELQLLIENGLNAVVVYHSNDLRFPRKYFLSELDQSKVRMIEIIGRHGQVKFDRAVSIRLAKLLKEQ